MLTVNKIPLDKLKVGDNVRSTYTDNVGQISKIDKVYEYIHVDWINGNKSIHHHSAYEGIEYKEIYDGPDFLAIDPD